MNRPVKPAHIYSPRTISELLSIRKAHPRGLLFAGGTYLMSDHAEESPNGDIISLALLSDFNRLSRTETYLEAGPGVTIQKLLSLKRYLAGHSLYTALQSIGTAPVKNTATLGGNIALGPRTVNLLPVLYLLGTRIELRRSGNTSWVSIRKYYESAGVIRDENVITRIRIPTPQPAFERYELIRDTTGLEADALAFYSLADIHKDGGLASFGCCYCTGGARIIRNMDMESFVEGKKLPLAPKDITRAVESIEETVESLPIPLLPLRKHQVLGLLRSTLKKLGNA